MWCCMDAPHGAEVTCVSPSTRHELPSLRLRARRKTARTSAVPLGSPCDHKRRNPDIAVPALSTTHCSYRHEAVGTCSPSAALGGSSPPMQSSRCCAAIGGACNASAATLMSLILQSGQRPGEHLRWVGRGCSHNAAHGSGFGTGATPLQNAHIHACGGAQPVPCSYAHALRSPPRV